MSNDIIKKFQKAQLLLNNNAYAEIKGNSDYDYLINELIEYIEENENDQYIITTQTIRNYQEQEKNAHTIMEQHQIRSLPILNEQGEIVKIYFGDEIVEKEKQKLDIPVVIMAGGKGTRLYPYTQILPKPLIAIFFILIILSFIILLKFLLLGVDLLYYHFQNLQGLQ